eukprot:m.425316 g.425316  ORF g.425316 m.425316 type:complete len:112 (+) comp21345_c0_seq8:114-449(+)
MAQGQSKDAKKKMSGGAKRAKVMKSKMPKKGLRDVKPKKRQAITARITHNKLTKQIAQHSEKEMIRRAGTVLPFKIMDDGEGKSDDKAAMEVEEARVAPKLGKKVRRRRCS